MIVGISGPQRSGKTPLAKEAAKELEFSYVSANVTAHAKKAGYDAVSDLSIEDRLALQWHLLNEHKKLLNPLVGKDVILDRTPLDMATYMLAEIGMHADPDLSERVSLYVRACLAIYRAFYSHRFITRPLLEYANSPDKPPENASYQLHFQCLLEGLAISNDDDSLTLGSDFYILDSHDFDHRLNTIVWAVSEPVCNSQGAPVLRSEEGVTYH